jgi:hypothetical protein
MPGFWAGGFIPYPAPWLLTSRRTRVKFAFFLLLTPLLLLFLLEKQIPVYSLCRFWLAYTFFYFSALYTSAVNIITVGWKEVAKENAVFLMAHVLHIWL